MSPPVSPVSLLCMRLDTAAMGSRGTFLPPVRPHWFPEGSSPGVRTHAAPETAPMPSPRTANDDGRWWHPRATPGRQQGGAVRNGAWEPHTGARTPGAASSGSSGPPPRPPEAPAPVSSVVAWWSDPARGPAGVGSGGVSPLLPGSPSGSCDQKRVCRPQNDDNTCQQGLPNPVFPHYIHSNHLIWRRNDR